MTKYLAAKVEFSFVYEQRQNEDIKYSIRKFSKVKENNVIYQYELIPIDKQKELGCCIDLSNIKQSGIFIVRDVQDYTPCKKKNMWKEPEVDREALVER